MEFRGRFIGKILWPYVFLLDNTPRSDIYFVGFASARYCARAFGFVAAMTPWKLPASVEVPAIMLAFFAIKRLG